MSELSSLPNIGWAVDEQLCSVGIKTCAELKELGAENAYPRGTQKRAKGILYGAQDSEIAQSCSRSLRSLIIPTFGNAENSSADVVPVVTAANATPALSAASASVRLSPT